MRKKIAILCSDDAHHKYLVGLLASRFHVAAVVVESGRAQRRRILANRKWVDYVYTLYHHARRTIFGLNAYRRRYFADVPPHTRPARVLEVAWINDPATAELLRTVGPDLTIVICTSILGPAVLAAAGPMIINVHGGFLPYYRGNHCFFFPFYRETYDRIGSTLHFVDTGIDTGAVIENVIPPIHPGDTPEMLYCRAERIAIDRLAEWIAYAERGGVIPRRTQPERHPLSRTRDRGPLHDLHLWLRRVTGLHRVPERPGIPLEPLSGADEREAS
jgi:methionyl-tRNA formyltransferase